MVTCFLSNGFVFTRSHNFVSIYKFDRDTLEHVSLIQLVTGIAMKPGLSGNTLPNIKTCENRCLNFSEILRVMAFKLFGLPQFASPNI